MMTSDPQQPQGFLLLSLPNASLVSPSTKESGTLNIECITVDTKSKNFVGSSDRDVWLVLRLNGFEMPVSPVDPIHFTRSSRTYVFEAPSGNVTVRFGSPSTSNETDDLDSFEVIISQYGVLQETESDSAVLPSPEAGKPSEDMRGKLVLVDELNGQILGSLGEQYRIREDAALSGKGKEKDPVIIEIPEETGDGKALEVIAHPILYEQQDILMKSSSLISRGIIYTTNAISSGLNSAATYYVNHSKPSDQPVEFSERTRGYVRRVHNLSGKAVKVSAKTTGMINGAIDRAMSYVASNSEKAASSSKVQLKQSRPASPVPPVHATDGKSGAVPGVSKTAAPPLPPRKFVTDHLDPPPAYPGSSSQPSSRPTSPAPTSPAPAAPMPPPLLNRVLLSTDMLLTTIERSAYHLASSSNTALSSVLGHKYGPEVGNASWLMGSSVTNVGVVYIDMRGVGRRALLRRAGKGYIKAKLGKKDVVLGVDEQGRIAGVSETPAAAAAAGQASGAGKH